MSFTPGGGHEALRRGRWSTAGADYFLTVCTDNRAPGLTHPEIAPAILSQMNRLVCRGLWRVRVATIMPEHVHLLATLGEDRSLPGALRIFKGGLAPVLRTMGLRWQRGYFDHRMRRSEDRLPVIMYVYLNPYRARLISADQKWAWFRCAPEDWSWFAALTNAACPFPDWLRE